jgi:hypothetical protein
VEPFRDQVVVASKFGFDLTPAGEFRGLNSRPEHADDVKEIEEGFAKIRVQGAWAPTDLLQGSDIGARLGTSSAGGPGISPVPRGSTP